MCLGLSKEIPNRTGIRPLPIKFHCFTPCKIISPDKFQTRLAFHLLHKLLRRQNARIQLLCVILPLVGIFLGHHRITKISSSGNGSLAGCATCEILSLQPVRASIHNKSKIIFIKKLLNFIQQYHPHLWPARIPRADAQSINLHTICQPTHIPPASSRSANLRTINQPARPPLPRSHIHLPIF